MKRILKITLACVLLVGMICALAACSEKMSQKAVSLDKTGASVQNNGGMAVKYGKYVYFVNGYAGESAANEYGQVVRGAIMRTTLDEKGEPDYKSVVTIAPKNVYGEDKTHSGIYIVGDHVYYNTTSTDKNSKREYKTTEGVIMRTTLDGSKTEAVKELNDNDVILYAGDNSNYLVYAFDNYLYAYNPKTGKIDLLTKSNAKNPKSEEQTYVAVTFGGDYAVYTMYNYADEANYSSDYIVWAFDLKTGEHKAIMSSDIYNGDATRSVLYTTSVVDVVPESDGFTLYYSKTGKDNESVNGFYSQKFAASDLTFKKETEVRYTYETTTAAYTKFAKLSNGYTLAFNTNKIDVYDASGNKVKNNNADLRFTFQGSGDSVTVTPINFVETDSEVYVNYIYENSFRYIKLFNKDNGTFTPANENMVKFFSAKYCSDYISYDIIDNVIYYCSEDLGDNVAYFMIPTLSEITSDTVLDKGKILGKISDEDLVTLVQESSSENQ